ncbi:MAG: efflux RND transporter permease subunit, partial [Persicimonas sp.]
LLVMFGLMAIAFRSYLQPFVIMFAIPFGFVGALAGHLLMGYDLSLISMMGIVALSGVVVNDSLVLIAAINDYRREGADVLEAVASGGARRFRPILLTSLTTFLGLTPMILETSVQARFLIPMAVSLGFGVLFVTVIALLIVPAAYMAVEDVKALGSRVASLYGSEERSSGGAEERSSGEAEERRSEGAE